VILRNTTFNQFQDQEPKKGKPMSSRRLVNEVLKYVELNDEDLFALDQYTDKQLESALFSVKKKDLDKPAPYLMAILRNMNDKVKVNKPGVKRATTPEDTRQVASALHDRYAKAEVVHCEKILQIFDRIWVEHEAVARSIVITGVAQLEDNCSKHSCFKWSNSWSRLEIVKKRLKSYDSNFT